MATTIHLNPELLASVDHRAKELGLSRNRYIIRALERVLESETRWSPRFVEELRAARHDKESQQMLEELMASIASSRTRKSPPPF